MTNWTAGLHWMVQQTVMQNKGAREDIENLRLEMKTLLRANSQTNSISQQQSQVAVAAVLAFGIGSGDELLCIIKSVSGGCDTCRT